MKRIFVIPTFGLMLSMLLINLHAFAQSTNVITKYKYDTVTKYKYNNVQLKQPVASKSMLPAIGKYNKGDYVGAMIDLKEIVKKEKENTYAQYYLALCYTRLGYRDKANELYNKIADEGDNYSLKYYSRRAAVCIENPDDEICLPPKKVKPPVVAKKDDEQQQDVKSEGENTEGNIQKANANDIEEFIRSGKKIHPAAMDRITKDRMERKIQADEYSRKQAEEANKGN